MPSESAIETFGLTKAVRAFWKCREVRALDDVSLRIERGATFGLLGILCFLMLGCGPARTGAARIDPALAALVPSDTTLLAGVQMEALRATPLWQKYTAGRPLAAFDEFTRETGLDLRKDVGEVLIASNGKDTAVMARGKFSPQGIEPRIERPGVTRTPYKGYTLIGGEAGAVVFMNSTTAVAGRASAVRYIIDQRSRSNGPPPALRGLLGGIPMGDQIWLAAAAGFSQLERALPQSGNAANLRKIASMLEGVTAGADLRSGVAVFAAGVCRTDQDAQSLGAALRGLAEIGRLSTPSHQLEMLYVYDAVHIDRQQRTVRVDITLPEGLVEMLIGKFQPPAPGQGARPR